MAFNKGFDDEATLLHNIASVPINKIALFPNNKNTRLIKKLLNERNIKKWHVEAENTNFPPDVYIDEYKLMGDFMMVNDSEHYVRDKKGNLKNRNIQKTVDLQAYKKITNQIDMSKINGVTFVINGDTSKFAPEELHNFHWYLDSFKRIVGNHIRKIPTYQNNHPGYKTILFIVDESTGYCEVANGVDTSSFYPGKLHIPYVDYEFMKIFINTNVDYIVLHMPWKIYNTPFNWNYYPHQLVIIDVKYLKKMHFQKYNHENMVNCGWI